MKIVIDMSEEEYNLIKMKLESNIGGVSSEAERVIANGTPLPKGHGDLKDADKLKHAFFMWGMAVQGNFTESDMASIICNSPTIIEADKEAEDESD